MNKVIFLFLILFSCYGYAQGAGEPTDLDSFCDCEKDGNGTLCGRSGERTTSGHYLMRCCRKDTPKCYIPPTEKDTERTTQGQCCEVNDNPGPEQKCQGDNVVDVIPLNYQCNPPKIKCCNGVSKPIDTEECCVTDATTGKRGWIAGTKQQCCEAELDKNNTCITCEEQADKSYAKVMKCNKEGCPCDAKGCCKELCQDGEVYCDENGCQTPPADDDDAGDDDPRGME